VSWHRRKLAVVAAIAAVLTAISAAAPAEPATVQVVRAVVPLPPGTVVGSEQVRVEVLPRSAVPQEYVSRLAEAVGQTVLAGVPPGQVLTPQSWLTSESAAPGRAIAPVRLGDADVAALLRAGDRVDVLGADGDHGAAVTLAERCRVVAVPPTGRSEGFAMGDAGSAGALVLLDVDLAVAKRITQAAVSMKISVVLRS